MTRNDLFISKTRGRNLIELLTIVYKYKQYRPETSEHCWQLFPWKMNMEKEKMKQKIISTYYMPGDAW